MYRCDSKVDTRQPDALDGFGSDAPVVGGQRVGRLTWARSINHLEAISAQTTETH